MAGGPGSTDGSPAATEVPSSRRDPQLDLAGYGPDMNLRAIPTEYAGVHFRSTLEADWARNLDVWGITWQYEPEAVQLPSGIAYRPDFYLPQMGLWAEVKGNHDERISKAEELATVEPVVLLRPPVRGKADWESPSHLVGLGLTDRCPHRPHRRFVDLHDDNWYRRAVTDPICSVEDCLANYDFPASQSDNGILPTTKFLQLKDEPAPATRRY